MRPPCWNQASAIRTVSPAARKLIATPEMSWLPRKVIEAMPWIAESTTEAAMPARSPSQTEPVIAAKAAEKKAAASILPSRPMSKMPALSEKSPARQAKRSGIARRIVVSRTGMMASIAQTLPVWRWGALPFIPQAFVPASEQASAPAGAFGRRERRVRRASAPCCRARP